MNDAVNFLPSLILCSPISRQIVTLAADANQSSHLFLSNIQSSLRVSVATAARYLPEGWGSCRGRRRPAAVELFSVRSESGGLAES